MEEIQHRQPQSLYGVRNLRDVNGTTLSDNKMWGTGTSPYDEPSPGRERKRGVEIVSKSPPLTSWWDDRDAKRKRRLAKYRFYEAEGKLRSSLKKGFRSFKMTCARGS